PASVKAALALLGAAKVAPGGRRIAVLGDMLELGAYSRKLHESLATYVEQAQTDILLLAGSEMAALAGVMGGVATLHRDSVDELKSGLLDTVGPGDVVMISSSKSVGFSKLVAALLKTFPAAGKAADRTEHLQ